MTTLRTTAIMKTDIWGSTVRVRALPEVDLDALLTEHRQFVSRLAAAYDGRIVKPEGDGFWVVFPSVTAGALAAIAMQEELRLARVGKGGDRLAMRIVLTLGDVLRQEGALVGDAVVLAARIEDISPPDEIYLSTAAWLTMNQAEVRTSFVDAFALKGFLELVPVYRVEQTHRSRVIAGQYIVITNLHGYIALVAKSPMGAMEQILNRLFELHDRVCRECSGTHHFEAGDLYCLTFLDPSLAVAAVERLEKEWDAFERGQGLGCPYGQNICTRLPTGGDAAPSPALRLVFRPPLTQTQRQERRQQRRGEAMNWHRRRGAQPCDGSQPRQAPSRPKSDPEVEAWVVGMAREHHSWGDDRLVGALAHRGATSSAQTVGHLLKRHGIIPASERKKTTTWKEFIHMHMDMLVATDFFTTEV